MADIIEKANNAYEERDKAHNQIQTLKVQAKKEAEEFEKEIKEISYLMEKIKLSDYAKKNEKLNESVNGGNFYDFEQSQPVEKKNIKYLSDNLDKARKIMSRWTKFINFEKISPKLRQRLKFRTLTNC